MTTIRTAAIAAYDAACAMPAGADWRSVADMLRSALAGRSAAAATGFPAWWADYALPKHYTADSVDVLFHDGETIRANVFQAAKKPARIAATIRTAIAFYRARTGAEAVPPIASVTRVSDGATFDAAACSEFTAELRSKDGARVEAHGPRAITSQSIARMEAELERREAGLAVAADALAHVMCKPLALRLEWLPAAEARVAMWQAAVTGGREELARMHAAYGEAETAPLCARGAPIEQPAPVPAAVEAVRLEAEAVAEALAPAYPEAVEVELSGTFETGTLIFAATIVSPDLNAPPVEAIPTSAPVEAIAATPCSATESDMGQDLTTEPAGEWHPTAESHPIVALCLSPAAAEALFELVLDGTFHASGRTAKGGAWRLTLEDARACADIPSLRLVGMPRKPYPRRAAPSVEAIPVVEIRTGLAAMPPAAISGATPRPIVYHSPA